MTERIKARAHRPLPMLEKECEAVYQEYKRSRPVHTAKSLGSFMMLAIPIAIWSWKMVVLDETQVATQVAEREHLEVMERWDQLERDIEAGTIEIMKVQHRIEILLDEFARPSRCVCERC